jgi:hypothetical protein
MADVTIKYKGATIAEMSGTSEKTLETSGTYCEGDIDVVYAPRSKTYEITLAKASGWVLLTALDAEVLEHINDESLVVSLVCVSEFNTTTYAMNAIVASNHQIGQQGNYPVYGTSVRQASTTTVTQPQQIYYPPNKTDTNTSLGGGGVFRLDGSNYYSRPTDGYFRAGTYRLTFTW